MNKIVRFYDRALMFREMRDRVRAVTEHFQTDLAVDVELILERIMNGRVLKAHNPTVEMECSFTWFVGKNGTHLVFWDSDSYSEQIENIKENYPDYEQYEITYKY